jgi:hypothetical protein
MKGPEAFPSKFFRSEDIDFDEDAKVTLVIAGGCHEELPSFDGSKPEKKFCLRFKDEKRLLVLNKTNWNRLVHNTGEEDSDDWVGKTITVYVDRAVPFGSEIKSGLRVAVKGSIEETEDDDISF